MEQQWNSSVLSPRTANRWFSVQVERLLSTIHTKFEKWVQWNSSFQAFYLYAGLDKHRNRPRTRKTFWRGVPLFHCSALVANPRRASTGHFRPFPWTFIALALVDAFICILVKCRTGGWFLAIGIPVLRNFEKGPTSLFAADE